MGALVLLSKSVGRFSLNLCQTFSLNILRMNSFSWHFKKTNKPNQLQLERGRHVVQKIPAQMVHVWENYKLKIGFHTGKCWIAVIIGGATSSTYNKSWLLSSFISFTFLKLVLQGLICTLSKCTLAQTLGSTFIHILVQILSPGPSLSSLPQQHKLGRELP